MSTEAQIFLEESWLSAARRPGARQEDDPGTEALVMTARDRPPLRRSPKRLLHDGFFASLTHAERSLYLFLVLTADRNGVSYYDQDRMAWCTDPSSPRWATKRLRL